MNSDVPGGFAEASALPRLACEYLADCEPAGDIATALVSAIAARIGDKARVAFAHATSYADDRQVMQFLADHFAQKGLSSVMIGPDHLRWQGHRAFSIAQEQEGPIDAIVRFFPAEWLPNLPRHSEWRGYFQSQTLMSNPPQALLSQSKRLPLVWDQLGVAAPTWRSVLPETRDPRDAPWRKDPDWLLKPAFGRVGEGITWRGWGDARSWRRIANAATIFPSDWVAQRRFKSAALASRDGPRHLCIGVFTVEGRASGFYGRLSPKPVIEKHAQEIPVLIADPTKRRRHAA